MKNVVRFMKIAAWWAVLLLVPTLSAVAQSEFTSARFDLPFQVEWQGRTLPPGHYEVEVKSELLHTITMLRKISKSGEFLEKPIEFFSRSGNSYDGVNSLTIATKSGKAYVRSFRFGDVGKEFVYATPKEPAATRRATAALQILPVQSTAK